MTLYFFTFQAEDGLDYEAVENAEQAAKYADAGWCPVSRETFMDAWKRRDARDLARIWAEVVPGMVMVAAAPIKDWTPKGFRLYQV